MARERDLCDVKIKITEHFGTAGVLVAQDDSVGGYVPTGEGSSGDLAAGPGRRRSRAGAGSQPFGVLAPSLALPRGHPGEGGKKYYTIQRVNGLGKGEQGAGNGEEGEGIGGVGLERSGRHRHTLADSDRIKKNSVVRGMLKEEKEGKKRKAEVCYFCLTVRL